jgi:sodium transport system ATP-binding protein
VIEVKNLDKFFADIHAVDGLSFEARDGEILGLIGHNGAGKTTTFRIIAGLLRPDAGCTIVDGFNCQSHRLEAQRRLGILPDVRGLYPRLTGREHILYYGRLHGLESEALERRADELMDRLGMADFAHRRCKGYSRGQELKVALARALVHEPHNMIFDEPTNGLDVTSSRSVHDLIREMRDQGRSIIISSHIMSEVSALCDRLVIMADGALLMHGSPEELLRRTGRATLEDIFLATSATGKEAAE